MTGKKKIFFIASVGLFMLLVAACGTQGDPGPQGDTGTQGDAGPAGPMLSVDDLSCTDCHNDTTIISGKTLAWEESGHGTGTAYGRGSSASCAGCHSGGAFSERVVLGLSPAEVEAGDPNPTKQDCRACHQIHTTYTGDDFALETVDPVALYALGDVVFDGGKGNLCANCHQPRRTFPDAVEGIVEVTSTHWGPHHGVESAMLLGLGGAGVEGSPSKHAEKVENTCVDCHLGEGASHSFEPQVAACLECHDDVENFDLNGVQTEVQAMLDELLELLEGEGMYADHPVVGNYDEAKAAALWNYILVAVEDTSLGVHNSNYVMDLLEASLAAFE